MVHVERLDRLEEALLLVRLHGEELAGPGHQGQVGDRGLVDHLLEVHRSGAEEVRERERRTAHAQHRVQVGAPEVDVDDDAPAPALGEGDREVRGDDGLADAALAAADGPEARPPRLHRSLEQTCFHRHRSPLPLPISWLARCRDGPDG